MLEFINVIAWIGLVSCIVALVAGSWFFHKNGFIIYDENMHPIGHTKDPNRYTK